MRHNSKIVALFADTADEARLLPSLSGIEAVTATVSAGSLSAMLPYLLTTGGAPGVVVLSGSAYRRGAPVIVGQIREALPGAEIVVLAGASDSPPPVRALLSDDVRHLVVDQEISGSRRLSPLLELLRGGKKWNSAEVLRPGTRVLAFPLSRSSEKEEVIAALEDLVGDGTEERLLLRQKGALLADEMIENALYGAPRGSDGGKIFPKGEEREILPSEQIVFRCGFDGETLALEVEDGWGSLSPGMLMEYLAKNEEGEDLPEDAGGRGLFIIWRFLDSLHVNIEHGKQTVIGGHITTASAFDEGGCHGFSIITTP